MSSACRESRVGSHGARAHHATTEGETCRYEDNVLAIMQENLARL
jgi:hypothetical protein